MNLEKKSLKIFLLRDLKECGLTFESIAYLQGYPTVLHLKFNSEEDYNLYMIVGAYAKDKRLWINYAKTAN